MFRSIAVLWLAFGLALVTPPAAADGMADRGISVPGQGSLVFRMPSAWRDERIESSDGLLPTINLLPARGSSFSVLITPFWNGPTPNADFGTPKMVRSLTENGARWASARATETTLEIMPIGGGATGFYYTATDRAMLGRTPAPGEYLYVTQGQVMTGDLLCNFTILTNETQSPVIDTALRMLREAVHQPDG